MRTVSTRHASSGHLDRGAYHPAQRCQLDRISNPQQLVATIQGALVYQLDKAGDLACDGGAFRA